jgi:hypothetical protein
MAEIADLYANLSSGERALVAHLLHVSPVIEMNSAVYRSLIRRQRPGWRPGHIFKQMIVKSLGRVARRCG